MQQAVQEGAECTPSHCCIWVTKLKGIRQMQHAHHLHFRPSLAQGGGGGALASGVPGNVAQHVQGWSHAGLNPAGGSNEGLQPRLTFQVKYLPPQLLCLLSSYLGMVRCIACPPASPCTLEINLHHIATPQPGSHFSILGTAACGNGDVACTCT